MVSLRSLICVFSILIISSGAPSADPASKLEERQGCTAVKIMSLRGSDETIPGRLGAVENAIHGQTRQSVTLYDVPYPASGANYNQSESQGVALLKGQLATAKASCPVQKIVVMGYSQGAQVVADVLQSRSTGTDLIKAAILFADPTHTANQPFNAGTGNARSGLSPRASGALNAFSSVLQSYCLVNDPVCARGGNVNDHLVVVSTYQNQAVSFALGKIGG
ncbi:carbohydrate esterase family 5 protein [Atractiella rhizophila]|nr:carbohydrate esterase family 5 protein [Atractiella rhizophila]